MWVKNLEIDMIGKATRKHDQETYVLPLLAIEQVKSEVRPS